MQDRTFKGFSKATNGVMWAVNGTAFHSTTVTIAWYMEDLIHDINSTTAMRKMML
jgi:hypothetical protein